MAHKGFVAFEAETEGRAAHGSRPDLGIDAIAAMGAVLSRIAELDGRLREGAEVTRCSEPGSVHASVIEGGQEYSSYPARCLVKGERRTIPGETVEDVRAELEALVAGHRRDRADDVPSRPVRGRSRRAGRSRAPPPPRPSGRRRGRLLGRLRAPRRRRHPDRRLRADRGGHPRHRRMGRPRLARAVPRGVPRRREARSRA